MTAQFLNDIDDHLAEAVRHFWQVRDRQAGRQGGDDAAAKDRGGRGAVTGGKQMDGFITLTRRLLVAAGLTDPSIHVKSRTELPGWFRSEKDWDLLVFVAGRLVAVLEFKSHVGPSFGNNFNNRTEEAIGSATDLWAAYRHGAFAPSAPPWVGYLMLLEDDPGSSRPIRASQPHFPTFPEFHGASYARRYEVLLTKLVRERLYDSACLILSRRDGGGAYSEPSPELVFRSFVASLLGRVAGIAVAPPLTPKTRSKPGR